MFVRDALSAAVETACDPDPAIDTISTIEAGNNHAYRVTLADDTDLLLKVGTRFPDAFPAEPATMRRVRAETDLPVPRVHGTGTDPLEYPYAVYEYVPDCEAEWVGDLSHEAAQHLCREAGRHLRELHRITFPEFGRIGLDTDASADDTPVADVLDADALTVVDPTPLDDLLRQSLDRQLGDLADTPFDTRRDSLEALGTDLVERIDYDDVTPALVHGDYRLDNLCVDPSADRVTAAVLDWELPTALDPLWDAVMAQSLLTAGHRLDPDSRRSLRRAFWDAYGNGVVDTPRRRCYELLARIRLARHLDTECRGLSDAARRARITDHHEAFDELLADR
ncbi:putative aminoglycoside phosphotransferase [Halovivax ruber XH-70]|uniref:Putative aminoglycoside phosphotransferase n=1 Tax=Halovivax ruber (strain DSM 18193 / JCM 13892 / XH-70) TaxID=797302 RepID=L0I7C1_HALRX|nr:phosphotransferase [Halovivax ruber]AGB15460.1 putative aminoglycoside phosphotransferase [Halovivax ruber XH-70]